MTSSLLICLSLLFETTKDIDIEAPIESWGILKVYDFFPEFTEKGSSMEG